MTQELSTSLALDDLSTAPTAAAPDENANHDALDKRAVILLLCQHFSSTWSYRSIEFSVFLALASSAFYPNTLLP